MVLVCGARLPPQWALVLCDSLDCPVVIEARVALGKREVAPVLECA